LGGVVPFDASADALLQAVRRLRGEREWPRALSAVPTVDGDADVQRWLDAHESAYGAALGERASAVSA
jgi:hypothetical protein